MKDGSACALVVVPANAADGDAPRIWGMSAAERLRRSFIRAGLRPAGSLADCGEASTVLLALGDRVFDEGLIKALAAAPESIIIDASGQAVAAHVAGDRAAPVAAALAEGRAELKAALADLARIDPAGLSHNSALRKREVPVLERLTASNVRAVEAQLFKGSYKGVTDLITKYAWPVPARIVTRWCALAGVTPNQVTLLSIVLVAVAFYLFWIGEYGWGLVAGWIMTFLDTVDGKLARVSLRSSAIGNVLDHGTDLVHPPFWWWAWFVGLQTLGFPLPHGGLLLTIVVGGYVAQRIEEGIFIRLFGMQMHAWRRFDSRFRLITARRNPNLILLTLSVLAGRPDIGFIAVAVWTAISFLVHLSQIVQGLAARKPLVSWLAG